MNDIHLKPMLAFINQSGQKCGDDRFTLLRAVDEHGTLSAAAKQVGLSYKAAWDAINAMNNLFERPLVLKQTGGKKGGGCELTMEGRRALSFHNTFQNAMQKALQAFSLNISDPSHTDLSLFSLFGAPPMKTTARNAYFGRVSAIEPGAINTEVQISISAENTLTAIITNHSAKDLGLAIDSEVCALIKASAPILMSAQTPLKTSARNMLFGHVQRIETGTVSAEVVLDLGEGKTLCAIVTNDSVKTLGFKPGDPLYALIKSTQIILAVT